MSNFHIRIQEFRQRAGITQTELADKVGLPCGAITAIEQGQRKVSLAELIKFCLALKCSLRDLLSSTQPGKKNILEMYDLHKKHYRRRKTSPPPERGNPIDNYLRRVNPYYQPAGNATTIKF